MYLILFNNMSLPYLPLPPLTNLSHPVYEPRLIREVISGYLYFTDVNIQVCLFFVWCLQLKQSVYSQTSFIRTPKNRNPCFPTENC